MQRLEFSGARRPLYVSLGFKGLNKKQNTFKNVTKDMTSTSPCYNFPFIKAFTEARHWTITWTDLTPQNTYLGFPHALKTETGIPFCLSLSDGMVWTGLFWLRTRTRGDLFKTRQLNLRVLYNSGNITTSCESTSFSRTLMHRCHIKFY
jgi:hypothetical protein